MEPTLTRVKNGWHAGNRALNLTVWGATEHEARAFFHEAVAKDAEVRGRAPRDETDGAGRPANTPAPRS
jgi:hypothetical protein